MPNSTILMHQPSGGIGGTATDIKIQAEQMRYVKKRCSELTARHTGQPLDKILKDADRDHWYTAQEAKEYGFVDHVVSSAQEPERPARSPPRRQPRPRQLRRPTSADREKPNVTQYPSSRYVLPSFVERTSYGVKEIKFVQQALRGAHHLPGRPDRRRECQRCHGPVAHARGHRPGPRDHECHQTRPAGR